jgi:perosamine synthetase
MQPEPVPWCVPDLSGNEPGYLAQAIAAGQAGPAGDFLARFEAGVAELAGVRYAVATCTGTAALHIAFLLAGVRPGDEVIVPAWTFVATANAVRHAGGHPVALDLDPRYWQLDPDLLEEFLTGHCCLQGGRLTDPATGRRVAAVAPVDLLGHPADLDTIGATASRHGIAMVEDAAQGLGAACRGRPAGGSGLAAASFNANKLITAGSGGAILTNDQHTATRARYLINQARDHPVEYRHGEPAWNYRMTNLHAAVGCAQLDRAGQLIAAKQRIHARYVQELAGLDGVRFQQQALGHRNPLDDHHRHQPADHRHHRQPAPRPPRRSRHPDRAAVDTAAPDRRAPWLRAMAVPGRRAPRPRHLPPAIIGNADQPAAGPRNHCRMRCHTPARARLTSRRLHGVIRATLWR